MSGQQIPPGWLRLAEVALRYKRTLDRLDAEIQADNERYGPLLCGLPIGERAAEIRRRQGGGDDRPRRRLNFGVPQEMLR